jgi:excisionase family DNA binding protein
VKSAKAPRSTRGVAEPPASHQSVGAADSPAQGSDVNIKPARVTLRVQEASEALGMSVDSFERYVRPEIRTIRRGRMVLIPVSELSEWVERHAHCVGSDW